MTFDQLIEHFGTQQKTADALGVKQPTVCGWQDNGIPLGRQYQIQLLTAGRLKAEVAQKAA